MAAQPHYFNGKKETAYSSVLIGNYINEIVRRVDPKKRNIEEFVKEEINKPLGTEFYFTLTKELYEKRLGYLYFYPVIQMLYFIVESKIIEPIRVKLLGYEPDALLDNFSGMLDDSRLMSRSFKIFEKELLMEHANEYESATVLLPGVSLKTNAQSIAKVAALIANRGELNGVRLISKESLDKALEIQEAQYDHAIRIKFPRTQNGWAMLGSSLTPLKGNNKMCGWTGFGGSSFMFNIDKNLSMSFVMNGIGSPKYVIDPRAFKLAQSFFELIENDK